MLATVCRTTGVPPDLAVKEVAEPTPGPGEVLVRIGVAAVNFVDTLVIAGRYQVPFPTPFIPGSDLAGTVVAVGPDCERFDVGDRVYGTTFLGAFAEIAAVHELRLRATPVDLTDELACVAGTGLRTAYDVLVSIARLTPGETLVVLGASGAVGSHAIALGKLMGARVVACASSASKGEFCRSLGADEFVNYTTVDLKQELKRICPDGADVVVDLVGGEASELALRATGFGGRFVVVGFASGTIPRIPLNLMLLKGCSVIGYEIVDFERHRGQEAEANRAAIEKLLASGDINPAIVARYPLRRALDAIASVAGREKHGITLLDAG